MGRCLDMTGLVPDLHQMIEDAHAEKRDMVRKDFCTYAMLTWIKPFMLSEVVNVLPNNSSVLLLDVDILMETNIIAKMRKQYRFPPGHPIVFQKAFPVNTGLVWANSQSSKFIKNFWLDGARKARGTDQG